MEIREFKTFHVETSSIREAADRLRAAAERCFDWDDIVQSSHWENALKIQENAQKILDITAEFFQMNQRVQRGQIETDIKRSPELHEKSRSLKNEVDRLVLHKMIDVKEN